MNPYKYLYDKPILNKWHFVRWLTFLNRFEKITSLKSKSNYIFIKTAKQKIFEQPDNLKNKRNKTLSFVSF